MSIKNSTLVRRTCSVCDFCTLFFHLLADPGNRTPGVPGVWRGGNSEEQGRISQGSVGGLAQSWAEGRPAGGEKAAQSPPAHGDSVVEVAAEMLPDGPGMAPPGAALGTEIQQVWEATGTPWAQAQLGREGGTGTTGQCSDTWSGPSSDPVRRRLGGQTFFWKVERPLVGRTAVGQYPPACL